MKSVLKGTLVVAVPIELSRSGLAAWSCRKPSSMPRPSLTLLRAKAAIMKPPTSSPMPLIVSSVARVLRLPNRA